MSLLVHKDCLKISIIKIQWTTCEVFCIISIGIYNSKVIYFLFVLFLETNQYSPVQKETNRKLLTLIMRPGFLRIAFSGGGGQFDPLFLFLKKQFNINITYTVVKQTI